MDKDVNITKVEVLNNQGIVKIRMTYQNVDMRTSFDDNYFELSNNMGSQNKIEKNDTTTDNNKKENVDTSKKETSASKIDSIIYPLYIPDDTYLESQETIATKNGERVILTFAGDSPFTLIEETVGVDDYGTISVYGELEFINDTIGSIADGTATWISNGIEYYAVSETMDTAELLEVVNSVNVLPVGK